VKRTIFWLGRRIYFEWQESVAVTNDVEFRTASSLRFIRLLGRVFRGRCNHSALISNASNSTRNVESEVFSAAIPTDTSSGKSTVNSFATVHSSPS